MMKYGRILPRIVGMVECTLKSIRLSLAWKLIKRLDENYYKNAKQPEKVFILPDLAYVSDNSEEHTLDLIYPEGIHGDLPVIINVHGGGWVYGSKDSYYKYYCMNLARYGFAVLSMNYRMAPKFTYPAACEDVFSALRFVLKNAQTYRLDKRHIFLVGDSAGANICALTAVILNNPELRGRYQFAGDIRVCALGLCCGVFSFDTMLSKEVSMPLKHITVRSIFGTKEFRKHPLYQDTNVFASVTRQFTPCFIMGTKCDRLYPETARMIQCLQEKKVRHEALVFEEEEKLPHVFHIKESFPQSKIVYETMTAFFHSLCNDLIKEEA